MNAWVPVPASPVTPGRERDSEVTLPSRSYVWPSVSDPRMSPVTRLAASYEKVDGVPPDV